MGRDDLEHGWIVNDRERHAKEVYTCEWCGGEICDGEDYYDVGGDKVCEECINECRKTAYY